MKNLDLFIKKLMPVKKSVTIGVDLGHDCIRMVKAKRSDSRPVLLDQRSVPLPQSIGMGTPEFADLLRSELTRFSGPLKEAEIWAAMPSSGIDIRQIRTPKVAKKQIANAVYWTYKKEAPFDERETILDFELQGEVVEQDNPKLSVIVYTAPLTEVEEVKGLFSRIGIPLTGITVTPFALQNIFRSSLQGMEGTSAVLSISDDSSRLDIYAKGGLALTRSINTEINGTAEPSLPAIERLTRQIERTFEHYTINLGNEKIDRVYLSGLMNRRDEILEYMGNQLMVATEIFDPMNSLSSVASPMNLRLENQSHPHLNPLPEGEETFLSPPLQGEGWGGDGVFSEQENLSERISLVQAFGLALSDRTRTPNLLHIHKDKEKEASIIRINSAIFAVFMASVLICTGIFLYQKRIEAQKKEVLAGLEKELSRYNPRLDQNLIMQTAAKVRDRQGNLKGYGKRYLGMAVIGELSELTPANIRMVNLAVKAEGLTVEGVAVGDRYSAESSLSGFVMKLDGSPIFSQVSIQKGEFEASKGLHFTINIKVG